MANYAPSTRARIADCITGMRVETNTLAAATYLLTGPTATNGIFNVIGRVKIMQLYLEVVTLLDSKATLMFFTHTGTTPSYGPDPIDAVCGTMTAMAVGARVMCRGTTVATACLVDVQDSLSPSIMIEKVIIGIKGGIGTIGINTADASMTSGTFKIILHYVPMSDGAYVTNIL
jgi:hypothetical protein